MCLSAKACFFFCCCCCLFVFVLRCRSFIPTWFKSIFLGVQEGFRRCFTGIREWKEASAWSLTSKKIIKQISFLLPTPHFFFRPISTQIFYILFRNIINRWRLLSVSFFFLNIYFEVMSVLFTKNASEGKRTWKITFFKNVDHSLLFFRLWALTLW